MKNTFQEPYYLVDFNASICNFEILINDMPAFIHKDGGSIASHYPINHFICKTGPQHISARIFPLTDETTLRKDGFVKIKIHYDDATGKPDNLTEVFHYETPDLSASALPFIRIENVFDAIVPYELTGWSQSLDLKDFKSLESEAKAFYQHIHTLVKQNDNKGFLDVFATKFAEIDVAMYLGEVDNAAEWNDIVSQLKAEKFLLQDFPDAVTIILYGNGKIADVLRPNLLPILYFKNDKNEEFSLPVLSHKKNKNTPFSVIR